MLSLKKKIARLVLSHDVYSALRNSSPTLLMFVAQLTWKTPQDRRDRYLPETVEFIVG